MKEFYVIENGQQQGPFTIEQLAEMAITPETEVWTAGMADWQQAGDVAELTSLLQQLQFQRHIEHETATPPPYTAPAKPQQAVQEEPSQNAQQTWEGYHSEPVAPKKEKNSGCGVKILLTILILLVLTGIFALTCPSRQDHKEAISVSTRQWMNEKIDALGNNGMPAVITGAIEWISGQGADFAIDQFLDVDNYVVCSVGRINMGEKSKVVSVGLMNHVFTFDKEDVDEFLLNALKAKMGIDAAPAAPRSAPPVTDDYTDDEDSYLAPPVEEEDTSMDVAPANPAKELLDSIAVKAKREAIKATKEWAKKQIDRLGDGK